jgi:hypothetical protein
MTCTLVLIPWLCCTKPVWNSAHVSSVIAGMHEQTFHLTYWPRNWRAYNEALKRRGSLTIWFAPKMSWGAAPTGKHGRQKAQAVNIPYRGAKGPLHLLIDSTGIKVEGEGEWHTREHGGSERRLWRKIHLGIDEETLEVQAVKSTGTISAKRWCQPTCPTRFRRTSRSAASLPTVPTTPEIATMQSPTAAPTPFVRGRLPRTLSGPSSLPPRKNAKPWKTVTADAVARNEDALCETAGAAPHDTGLRPTGRLASGPYRRSDRLHRARPPCHRARGMSLSRARGTPAISQFVQQSRY